MVHVPVKVGIPNHGRLSYFFIKSYGVTAYKNRLEETILMSCSHYGCCGEIKMLYRQKMFDFSKQEAVPVMSFDLSLSIRRAVSHGWFRV